MAFVQNFPFFSIILAMFSGVLCAVLKPKMARNLTFTSITAIGAMSFSVLAYTLRTGEYYVYWMGHFPAPFGNEIRIGVFEALMASAFCVVIMLSLFGGLKHIFHDVEEKKVNDYFFLCLC